MKVSRLIAELTQYLERHGDKEVLLHTAESGDVAVDTVNFIHSNNHVVIFSE